MLTDCQALRHAAKQTVLFRNFLKEMKTMRADAIRIGPPLHGPGELTTENASAAPWLRDARALACARPSSSDVSAGTNGVTIRDD